MYKRQSGSTEVPRFTRMARTYLLHAGSLKWREINPDIRCFTIEVSGAEDEGMPEDLTYARKVAAHLNVPLEVVRMDAARMAEDLPAMVAQLDEPLADPAPLNVLYICQLAHKHGVKVLLSGSAGDDLFTGYRRHLALMTEKYWGWLPCSLRSRFESLTSGLDQRRPLGRRLRKLFNGASLNGDVRLINYFRWIDRKDLVALYTPEFRAALGSSNAEDTMLDFIADLPNDTTRLERMLALEQRFGQRVHGVVQHHLAQLLGQRALRVELKLKLAAEILLLEQLVLADIGRNHLFDLTRADQLAQALIVYPRLLRGNRPPGHAG